MSRILEKCFGFKTGEHSIHAELAAGLTTFLTMAYILAVNPSIFSALADKGMPTGSVFTATALAAVFGTLVMAFYAKKPFGVAPGMGTNTFFVFTVCLGMGYSWQFALTAVFLEGIIFIILTATKVRELILNSFPSSLRNAIGVGIGLYIAFIGIKSTGLLVPNGEGGMSFGSISDAPVQLALISLVLASVLFILKVKGALLISIVATTIIGIPMGVTHIHEVVSVPPSVSPLLFKFEWNQILSVDMLIVIITFMSIDFFNTIGTVMALCTKTGMTDKDGRIDGLNKALMADATATTAGSCFGASTTTTYLESATGVAAGGRTGLTAFAIAICFLISLFFAPAFLAIPSAATGTVLILVGVMMVSPVKNIDWDDFSEAVPAFITMLIMPLAGGISYGIVTGIISYVVLNTLTGKIRKTSLTLWILSAIFIVYYLVV